MSLERILELARLLSREEFAKSFPRPFLIILDTGEEEPPSSFETVDVSAAPRAAFGPRPAATLVHEIAKAEGNPYPDRISVGRARNCDIVLRQATVSKLHAHFLPHAEGELEIADVGSQVGTRLNGHLLSPNKPARVVAGAVLSIGRVVARVADARAAWDLLKAQGQRDEGSVPPPRSSVPSSVPAPRSSARGAVPPSRPSAPAPAPSRTSGVPPSAPSTPERQSGIRRADQDAEPFHGGAASGPTPREGTPGATRRG